MFPRALRALLEGARTPPGREEEGVVLSSYRANPPNPDPQQTELREADAVFWAAPRRYGAPHSRLLRAAPLPRLVRHLLESRALGDGAFVPAFLGTFRAFARPHDVLRLLLQRMEELGGLSGDPDTPAAAEAKRALAELLPRWLQDYPEDFGDAAAAALAERLGSALGPDSDVGLRLRELRDPPEPPEPPGDPYGVGDGDGDADPLEILSFQAQEVAEQLTLTEAVRPHSRPTSQIHGAP
ncbi:ral guanine nucleotide dissociation stimulator-like 2 isoform X2 [Phasianus colchicus]|uniref:ral guanine nucleotide dissociation stimulator-like 2 isoform X2 n=1 Tax=Phasianus colchicus TaxID=9054 RepID=UPI00129EC9E7|nr:ral guanine nucleotide dissociation stimulator-like 2 isoform X2 [Phasianus colchicus]